MRSSPPGPAPRHIRSTSLRRSAWGLLAATASGGLFLAAASCGHDATRPPYSKDLVGDASSTTADGSAADPTVEDDTPQCSGIARVVAITGQQGHFIQPKSAVYDETDFTISLQAADKENPPRAVHISVRQKDGGLQIDRSLDFGNADGGLAVGEYHDAGRYPFADPGLDLTGDGHGCNTVTGSFAVQELTFAPSETGDGTSTISAFAATFDHHCEGAKPLARGCVRWTR